MKKLISAVLSCTLAFSGSVPVLAQAPAMPTIWSASQGEKLSVETVQHRRYHGSRRYHGHRRYYGPRRYYGHRRYYRPYYGYGYRRYYDDDGAALAAGILGLAAGAAIASGSGYRSDWHAYCASKYRSYNPRTGTYLGYDGRRHRCR